MTDIQLYLLIAPLVLLAVGAGAAYWWIVKSDQERRHTR